MNINKNNFFWYALTFTTFFVIIYFFLFSGKNYQSKFVLDKINGNVIIKSFKDYKQLKEGMDLYKKLYSKNIIKLNLYEHHAKQIFSNITRFTQTNKNYKYQYKNFKELTEEEFKKLEKIINNISLEGAYFLTPEHIDKVTINLFLSKKNEKIIFLDYFKYIIDNEVDKYFQNLGSIPTESTYSTHISEINWIRDLNYGFISYVKSIIYGNKKINNGNIEKLILNHDVDELLGYLECSYYNLGTLKVSCEILTDEIVQKISNFYLKLNSINIFDIATSDDDTDFNHLIIGTKKRYTYKQKKYVEKFLFNELLAKWIKRENFSYPKTFYVQRGFSKEYIFKLKNASLLRDKFNLLDDKFSYQFINDKNYKLDEIKKVIFLNLNQVEFRRNFFELIPYLTFALIFSLISHIIYRSFSDD